MWLIIILFVVLLLLFHIKSEIPYKKFPPGPPRLPIIGSLLHFVLAGGFVPTQAFDKLAAKYGPVYGLKLGSVPALVLNSYEAIQSVAFHNDFQSHIDWDNKWLLAKSKGIPSGLFFASPTHWKDQLHVGNKILRKYGFKSTAILESLFMSEMTEFCHALKHSIETNGEVYRIEEQFHMIFFNMMWGLITGERCQEDDPFLAKAIRTTEDFTKSASVAGGLKDVFPELINLFPNLTGFTRLQKICDNWFDTIEILVKKYREKGTYKSNPNNFIEDYLLLVDKYGDENGDPIESIYTDFHIVGCIQDLLLAGIDTLSRTMKFIVLCLAKFPHVQEKIREEIGNVISKNEKLTSDVVERLIYTQATMLEIFRLYPAGYISLRKIWRPTKFGKYELPKGTVVFSNLYSANLEKSIWVNPNDFLPERFISTSNGTIINKEKILTFGTGKRACMGEFLAKRNMNLALVLLVERFIISEDPVSGLPKEEDFIHSFAEDLPPFNILIKIRNE